MISIVGSLDVAGHRPHGSLRGEEEELSTDCMQK